MKSDQSRLALAFALTGIILFGWQYFFGPKKELEVRHQESAEKKIVNNTDNSTDLKPIVSPKESETYLEVVLESGENKVKVNNSGNILEFKSSLSKKEFNEVVGENPKALSIYVRSSKADNWEKLNFQNFEKRGKSGAEGLNGVLGARTVITINEKSRLDVDYKFEQEKFVKFVLDVESEKNEEKQLRDFILLTKDVKRAKIGSDLDGEGDVKWFGVDGYHHLVGFILGQAYPAQYSSAADSRSLQVELVNPVKDLKLQGIFTQKNYDVLLAQGDKLELSVDFGALGILAVPMLHSLQFFYKLLPNYGLAIILLTIVLRILTFPLTYSSFKNMKKIQAIQPEMARIREKYKDDPKKLQKESMELFSKAGANPMSGCLPMLLQIPFFFAFYRMLNGAVELVDAPFIFWIKDLSLKDPFYVLPVLMSLSFFMQQKLTPSATVDPMQKKMMLAMPLVFGVLMKDLPAGLTLYMFVSTLFGIIQQHFVNKLTV